jgi:hypothetical protein
VSERTSGSSSAAASSEQRAGLAGAAGAARPQRDGWPARRQERAAGALAYARMGRGASAAGRCATPRSARGRGHSRGAHRHVEDRVLGAGIFCLELVPQARVLVGRGLAQVRETTEAIGERGEQQHGERRRQAGSKGAHVRGHGAPASSERGEQRAALSSAASGQSFHRTAVATDAQRPGSFSIRAPNLCFGNDGPGKQRLPRQGRRPLCSEA